MYNEVFRISNGYVPHPLIANVPDESCKNANFRREFWTGKNSQMTLMSIPVCSDIGLEIHEDTDQIIRIEQGYAMIKMGECERQLDYQTRVSKGDTLFVPAGIWHNIINMGSGPLKLSSIYSPPHHPVNTVQRTKEDSK